MTDFEPFDDDLAVALQRRAPQIDAAGISTASAHDAVLARARGIRRRRAGIAGGATLAAVIAGGVLLLNGNADDTLAPATEPSTSLAPETSPAPPSTSLAPDTSIRESVPPVSTTETTPITTMPETSLSTMPAATVDAQPPPSIGGQSASSSSSSSTSSSSSSSSSTSSTIASQGPAPFTKTYASSGGSITVSWDGSALSLDSVNPAAGHTAEIEDDTAARVRVRFLGPAESRIEIRFENGQVTERID
jgi:hypothetical protein